MKKEEILQLLQDVAVGNKNVDEVKEIILIALSVRSADRQLLIDFHEWLLNSNDYDINSPAEIKVLMFLKSINNVGEQGD